MYGVGILSNGIGAGDFNGDGIFDLAAANWNTNTISVLLGTPVPGQLTTTAAPVIYDTIGRGWNANPI